MKHTYLSAVFAAALAAGFGLAVTGAGVAAADEGLALKTNPGFNPDTGQINPGVPQRVPSASSPRGQIPTPAEARAAFTAKDQSNPGSGQAAPISPSNNPSPPETTGARTGETGVTTPSGPVGSTPQTLPANLSKRNDTLDRLPTMALPLALTDAQRQRIYQAAMADKTAAATDAGKLAPASALSAHQALNEMRPLPHSVGDIAEVKSLKYLKTKDKVLLVEPATRTVVGEITKQAAKEQPAGG